MYLNPFFWIFAQLFLPFFPSVLTSTLFVVYLFSKSQTCSESTTCIDDDDFDYDIDYDENDNGNDGNVTDTNRNHDAINEEEVINQKESEQTSSDIFNTLTTFENMTRSTVEYIEGM